MNILLRIRNKSLMECAKECLLTSQCKAINYRKNWKLCDALGDRPDGEAIQDESGSVYSDISTWPKALAGKCADHNCDNGKKCIIKTNGVTSCEHAYCKDESSETPFAVSTETFGVYANLEAGNQYECIHSTYELVGKPFVICDKKSKKWKRLFCCVEKRDSISNGSPDYINNGMKFSTYDRDNDNHTTDNCAEKYRGAWWFNACYMSHLNGEYDQNFPSGIQWKTFGGTLSSSIMEIRRIG
ncbi:Hypothetical predicted protein [Mytilus galloprovincialis]|uniref:Fibrinogen C-terminal domain-containing protein n=1 Tax=Mytilus galloprovincialis TaxID=29158 RepID=A0A8B6H8C6_MYTGA|nr:Hypothetical predicted protein [Mytilus galloprovincialis]